MKRVMKWGSNLITILLGIILVVTVYAAISSRLTSGNPTVFGLQWYEVLSGSMEPGIHTGSVIFDKPVSDVNKLKAGDVITFRADSSEFPGYTDSGQMVVTHRIQKIVQENGQLAFQTKGDANNAPDPTLVPAPNVIAQYDNITIPYVGYYLNFSKTKLGIALLLILPGMLLIVTTLFSLFREIQRTTKEEKKASAAETTTADTSTRGSKA